MKDTLRIIVLGDEGVGKSSLISAFVSQCFPEKVRGREGREVRREGECRGGGKNNDIHNMMKGRMGRVTRTGKRDSRSRTVRD